MILFNSEEALKKMLLVGGFSVAFLLKAFYGDKTFELSWHLLLTQVGMV